MMQQAFSVLLVDDLPTNLHTLSQILKDLYDVSIATSGADALRIAQSSPPDLILLDIMMPDMDGIETLHRLRTSEWGRDIPVILVTADDSVETQVKGLETGADDFITKPIVAPVLKARVHNVLERLRLHRELARLATTDELTGAMNRRQFYCQGEARLNLLTRYPAPCGLLMMDLDKFKSINDLHSHSVGDEVLVAFANTIQSRLRSSDFFGRIGGEEFAVLLPQTDAAGSLEVAERLRLAVAGIRLPLATGQVISVTTSIGSTQLWPSDAALDAALSRADKALYAAKSHGRNQTQELLSEPGASDSAVPDAVAS